MAWTFQAIDAVVIATQTKISKRVLFKSSLSVRLLCLIAVVIGVLEILELLLIQTITS
jgi:hypothetical protein